MISNDPTPTAKVFKKAMSPIHPRSVTSGIMKESIREQLTQNKVTLIRQWMHVCETNETTPATLSQYGGKMGDPARVVEGREVDETPLGI